MDTNNTTKNSKTASRLRRFAIGTVAAVAGLGLAGAGTAAAATPTTDDAPAVETEAANEVAYDVYGGLVELPPAEIPGFITGGHIFVDGTGYLEVTSWLGSELIEVKSSNLSPFGGFMTVTYNGVDYFGPLEPAGFGVYDAELISMWGMELGIESLMLVPTGS